MPRIKLTERAITNQGSRPVSSQHSGGQHKERQMRTITIVGRPSATIVDLTEPTGPRPAVGKHAEALVDIENTAKALLLRVELERSGVCDGNGFWVAYDPILSLARKLATLAEQRVSVAPR